MKIVLNLGKEIFKVSLRNYNYSFLAKDKTKNSSKKATLFWGIKSEAKRKISLTILS